MNPTPDTFDVLIVGGGSAGAVFAARLSQLPGRTVLLLEAGHTYRPGTEPAALLDPVVIADPDHDWGYTAHGNERAPQIPAPRGKVLGGSSAVNAAVATRARPTDFDKWGERGVDGWSFADVLPTFQLLENTTTGDDAYHGRTGPLSVRQRDDAELTPSSLGFINAAVANGYKRVHDFNGAEQNGVGGYPVNILDGVRQSSATAYVTGDVRARPNLTIRGDTTIDRVEFVGTTAIGVVDAGGTPYRAGEVILCGGTYGSASVLLRSGIGPADDLKSLGIEVVADLPVGRQLQDHPFFHNGYALAAGHLEMTPAMGALLWTASSEAVGDELDLQISVSHLMPGSLSPTGGAIVLASSVVAPESRGRLQLASRDPHLAPLIVNNFLGTSRDTRRMLEVVRLARAIARNPVFAPFTAGELVPGDSVTDADLADAVPANLATYGHPVATAPMGGPDDAYAVVDAGGAVKGATGLRVVDASIIPDIPSAPTNLTVIMLAEHIHNRIYAPAAI